MAKRPNIGTAQKRSQVTAIIEAAVQKREVKKLLGWMEIGDKHKCRMDLRLKGWTLIGEYWLGQGNFVDGIIALNRARRCAGASTKLLGTVFGSLDAFIKRNQDKFIRSDLLSLSEEVDRLLNVYKMRGDWNSGPVIQGRKILSIVLEWAKRAPEKLEGPVTHHVQKIVDAFRTDVTKEEVRADFARLIAPVLRDLLEQDEKEKANKDKARKKKIKKVDEPKVKDEQQPS
jgi:hypothetical protein